MVILPPSQRRDHLALMVPVVILVVLEFRVHLDPRVPVVVMALMVTRDTLAHVDILVLQ